MRYFMCFSYDGSKFNGYQKQKSKKTIQGTIEELLKLRFKEEIKITASGRTDALVHAYNQVCHFDLKKEIEISKLQKYLNDKLNGEIYIKSIKEVSKDIHARYNVYKKEYLYKINTGVFNPIEKDYVLQYNKEINLFLLKKASKKLVGEHDFSAFTTSDEKESYVRKINYIKFKRKNDYLYIYISGKGFLRYMIRNIVGVLLELNDNKINIKDIKTIIESKDRSSHGPAADASGLYLNKIIYKIK